MNNHVENLEIISDMADKQLRQAITKLMPSLEDHARIVNYSLCLPQDFNDDDRKCSHLFALIQADLCKHLARHSHSSSPKYIGVRTTNSRQPEYAVSMVLDKQNDIDLTDLASKGTCITTGKAAQAGGWEAFETHDLLGIIKDKVGVTVKDIADRQEEVIEKVAMHLDCRQVPNGGRTLFVSQQGRKEDSTNGGNGQE